MSDTNDIVDRLRAVLHNDKSVELMNGEAADEIDRLRADLAKAIAERDEAREMYCREAARHSVCRRSIMDARTIARMKGWDCFDAKEER